MLHPPGGGGGGGGGGLGGAKGERVGQRGMEFQQVLTSLIIMFTRIFFFSL